MNKRLVLFSIVTIAIVITLVSLILLRAPIQRYAIIAQGWAWIILDTKTGDWKIYGLSDQSLRSSGSFKTDKEQIRDTNAP